MARNKYTNECSIPHMRGRKQGLKGKRLSSKRVRRMPIDTDPKILKLTQKSVKLDKDPILKNIIY